MMQMRNANHPRLHVRSLFTHATIWDGVYFCKIPDADMAIKNDDVQQMILLDGDS
jgi:hypothetical protein